MEFEGIRIKGEMAFFKGHRGFATIFWIHIDEIPKVINLYGEPTNIGKRLYLKDVRGWELNLIEFIAIKGEQTKKINESIQ